VILVCGVLRDGMIELMCARLNQLGYRYTLLDESRCPGEFGLTWTLGGGHVTGSVSSSAGRVDLEEVTGIYARYVQYRGTPARGDITEREEELIRAEHQASLMSLLDIIPCLVVNRAAASISNDSKPYQQLLLASLGFPTPRTLITTIPEEAAAFYEACGKKIIYKSLSGVRSVVRRLEETDLPRLQLVRNCPTQFQEVIEGVDVRVHVVGKQIFATEMESAATDYRYASSMGHSLKARATNVPVDVAAMCLRLTARCGLMVSGIDLRRTSDGRYYCFEINPSPGFLFYERATGQPISKAVADLLLGGSLETKAEFSWNEGA
jgi:glutathione synthase/RimK-type ligase-like ATP-grasp enzyme